MRNQNHAIHRTDNILDKTASVYEQKGKSNRGVEKTRELSFSSLTPSQSEAIVSTIKKEAAELDEMSIEKKANVLSNPFEAFGHAKHYISSKLGIHGDAVHDLASSVVTKARGMQEQHGGEIGEMITGIVDHMDQDEVRSRVGASPMRKKTVSEVEEIVKLRLIEQFQMTAYQADQFKKIVIQQARNLLTQYRTHNLDQIAHAIIGVLVSHQDISLAYNISTSDRLRKEVEYQLTNM